VDPQVSPWHGFRLLFYSLLYSICFNDFVAVPISVEAIAELNSGIRELTAQQKGIKFLS
jgi:hypothetical protein